MSLKEYLEVLASRWLAILLITLLGGLAALGASLISTPMYQSETQMYVTVSSAVDTTGDLAQGASYSRSVATSYADVAKSEIVLAPVIEELDLPDSVAELGKRMNVSSPSETALINIQVQDESPEQAAVIAEAVGESFKEVVQKRLEPAAKGDESRVDLTTIQPATVAEKPVKPNTVQNTIVGLLMGFLLGIGFATASHNLDTRIRTPREAAEASGVPVVGVIAGDTESANEPLAIHTAPRSPRAESFRALRTNLQPRAAKDGSSPIVITSPNPDEQSSLVSANLALAIAESGAKVALIEADLRRPTLQEYLGEESVPGLSDVLLGDAKYGDAFRQWGRTNLHFLPAGTLPSNPSEILGSQPMQELLSQIGTEYEAVIIDAPPILSVTDAAVFGYGGADYVVVAKADSTRELELSSAVETLQRAENRVLGVVATQVSQKAFGRRGYGNYGTS